MKGISSKQFCPTNDFKVGKPEGKCWSNGNYHCNECKWLNPFFLDKEVLNNALSSQGGIRITTFNNRFL